MHVEEIIGDTYELGDAFHFNKLRHLSLTKVARMPTAFCIEQLQSLRLRDCDQTLEFLEGLTESYHIKLRSFEVAIGEDAYLQTYYEDNKPHPIESFLLSFRGLEELSISVSNTFHPVNPITNPICHHPAVVKHPGSCFFFSPCFLLLLFSRVHTLYLHLTSIVNCNMSLDPVTLAEQTWLDHEEETDLKHHYDPTAQDAFGNEEEAEVKHKVLKWW